MVLLEIQNVSKWFGGLQAINNVSINVESGKITSIIGPNGAGKTTLFDIVTGFIKAETGNVFLNGKDITNLPPYEIVKHGITRSFQLVRVFPRMSVIDNIILGYRNVMGDTLLSSIFATSKIRQSYRKKREEAYKILDYIGLVKYGNSIASNLSYGQQKLLELGRVLASNPKVIMLDEPMAGLNSVMIEKVLSLLYGMKKESKAVVLIEHNIEIVLSISDIINVLNFGELIASGRPSVVLKDENVIKSYLGIKKTDGNA